MSNYVKYYIQNALYNVIALFISGSIVQTFLAGIGFSVRQIGIYTALISIVQMLVTFLNIFVADNVKKPKECIAWLALGPICQCLPMMFFCFWKPENMTIAFYAVLFFCCVCNFFQGIKGILGFRLPYLIIEITDYARLENNNGIICGTVSVLASGAVTLLLVVFPMRSVMTGAYLISVVFSAISSCIIRSMKVRQEYLGVVRTEKFSWEILWRRDFRYFYVPNFLRGICMGVISVIPVICRQEITSDSSVLSGFSTILSVSMITGCMIYQMIGRKTKTAVLYLTWSILEFVFMSLMLSGTNIYIFCICYLILCMGFYITNVAVPVFITEIIPYKDIGTYTSVRIVVMTLGQAVASYGTTVLLDYVPAAVILVGAGCAQLISGIMYFHYRDGNG